jgi:two-component system chemotaxis response regulator CheB
VVVDDSPFVCRLLAKQLDSTSDLSVTGMAFDGASGLELIRAVRPDVVTLDLDMPGMNGLEALDRLMEESPTPVVVLTGVSRRAAAVTKEAMKRGAVDFIFKFIPGPGLDPETLRREIIAKVRAAAHVRVVRTLRGGPDGVRPAALAAIAGPTEESSTQVGFAAGVVVIGASTGGPVALRELLCSLPESWSVPIVVVQHMLEAFTGVLAEHLNNLVLRTVKEAEDGERLMPGTVLVAPGGFHVVFRPDGRVALNRGPEIAGHRPSIDVSMQSAAQVYGQRASGVLLTGMGEDGASGLVAIHARGGRTFAQDVASCVVDGMPRRAIERGVVDSVAPPAEIARLLALGPEVNAQPGETNHASHRKTHPLLSR